MSVTRLKLLTGQLRLHSFGAVARWEEVQRPSEALLSLRAAFVDEGRVWNTAGASFLQQHMALAKLAEEDHRRSGTVP